jgi:Helix-turn-helix domain
MTAVPTQSPCQEWIARRKAKGLSLRQIGEATKISMHYLEAIESGALDKLPGGAYTEGYIRQYALAVGDERNSLWNYYRSAFARVDPMPVAPEPGKAVCRLHEIVRSWLGRD